MFQTDMAADIIVNQLSPGPHSTSTTLVIWFIVDLHFGNTIQDKRRLEIFVFLSLTWHVIINDKIK